MANKQTIQLGSMEVHDKDSDLSRVAILIWGPAGCGKTTFAATAPGKKLWLSMGDNEHVSVMGRKDVQFVKLYTLDLNDLFKQAQGDNPFGLDKFLAEHTEITTVVFDSITALAFRALQRAIDKGIGKSSVFTPTIEAPGISAYGARNGLVLEVLTGLLRVTAKHDVHIILTAHEADPVTKKEGSNDVIDYITVQLGGQIINNTSWRLSEIWYMSQNETGKGERRLAIRPTRLRKPMKTRMFDSNGVKEFVLDYNADKPDKGQMTIAGWHEDWLKHNGQKLAIPQSRS